MSKKKKNLKDELVDLKNQEGDEFSLGSEALDMEFTGVESASEGSDDNKTKAQMKDNTIRLVHTSEKKLPSASELKQEERTEVKVSYGLPAKQQVPRSPMPEHDGGGLKHSEHLRIAQRKLNELEEEIIKLRRENEDLASAGATFKKINEDYFSEIENLKAKVTDQRQTFKQETALLKKINSNKEKHINELKEQIEELKSRIDNNFQRVRKREKDLEHRLEIAKIEEAAVLKSKDQLILDLKRRIDEISHESENFRKKSQENYKELQKKKQVIRGVIRALRIAMTKLEGDDDSDYGYDSGDGDD